MPIKRAIIDQKIQIVDIVCKYEPRFQKSKKNLKSVNICTVHRLKRVENGPNLTFFASFDHLATPGRAQTPTKTLIDIDSMSCDMLGHSSVHFGGVRGRSGGPTAAKNHEFSGFCDFP